MTSWLLVPAMRHAWLLAGLVGAILCGAALLESSSVAPLHGSAVLGAVVLGLAAPVAHRLPLLGLAVLWLTPLITWDPAHPVRLGGTQLVALMILVGYASYRLPFRAGLLGFILSAVLPALSTVLLGQTWWEFLFYPLIMAPPWVVGLLLRRERRRSAELARLGRQLADERELRTTMALAAERARIAQELHDAVAHTVSVMTLQVGVVRRRLPSGGAEHDTLAAAERLGRQAVAELRQIVGLVRSEAADPLAPLPSLRNLQVLSADVRATGTAIVTDVATLPDLPPALDTAAYRVLQEAVTNALRHAPGSPITITVGARRGELQVEVANAIQPSRGSREIRPGNGITGMQERIRTFGGSFEVVDGPDQLVVRVAFPLPAEVPTDEVGSAARTGDRHSLGEVRPA